MTKKELNLKGYELAVKGNIIVIETDGGEYYSFKKDIEPKLISAKRGSLSVTEEKAGRAKKTYCFLDFSYYQIWIECLNMAHAKRLATELEEIYWGE